MIETMRVLSRTALVLLVSALLFTGCDGLITDQPLDQISDENVWEDENLIEAYLNDIYIGMGHGFNEMKVMSLTDEGQLIHGYGTSDVVQSNMTPGNLGGWGDFRMGYSHWDELYSRIRNVNVFLENIEEAELSDEDQKERMTGEAHFLRAYFYHTLMKLWGGVPVVDKVFDLDDDFLVERNSLAETVDFIVEDLDRAAELLPLEHGSDDLGRATEGAALALKSRILLYAASDLYHESGNPEEVAYQSGDREQMWRDAQQAAQDVIDLGIYDLYAAEPAEGDSTAQNYAEIFTTNAHEEAIMSHYVLSTQDFEWWQIDPGLHNGPNGYNNWGGNTPIQNLVDDYEMADGTRFDWDNGEHAADPYADRDPRFYASILYDGAPWRDRPETTAGDDPVGIVETALSIRTVDDGGNVLSERPGLDTRQGPIEDWNGTYSGYYLRKFISEDVDHEHERQEVGWHYFRYAEVLLNYAEASIELGEEDEALDAINQIRRRAGMPEIDESGQDLVERYRNERRIELAFEEHRYFDVRRWMIAPEVLDEDAYGIELTADNHEDNPHYMPEYADVERIQVQERQWRDRAYFHPIPRSEMNRNELLVQNPGY